MSHEIIVSTALFYTLILFKCLYVTCIFLNKYIFDPFVNLLFLDTL